MSHISRMLSPCVISIALTMISAILNSSVARAGLNIMNNGTAKCLAIHSTSPETPVVQEICSATSGQNWTRFTDFDGVSRLQNDASQLCMAAPDLGNGLPVVMRSCDDPSTAWQRRVVDNDFDIFNLLTNDAIVIFVAGFPISLHFCLDLENGDRNSGVPLQVWLCNSQTNNQIWRDIVID
jgi:hypothetical protein